MMVKRRAIITAKELDRALLPALTTLSSPFLTILSCQIALSLTHYWRTASWHRHNGGVAGEDDEELIAPTSRGAGGKDAAKPVVLVSRFRREAEQDPTMAAGHARPQKHY